VTSITWSLVAGSAALRCAVSRPLTLTADVAPSTGTSPTLTAMNGNWYVEAVRSVLNAQDYSRWLSLLEADSWDDFSVGSLPEKCGPGPWGDWIQQDVGRHVTTSGNPSAALPASVVRFLRVNVGSAVAGYSRPGWRRSVRG
jgi:hypothetical protein